MSHISSHTVTTGSFTTHYVEAGNPDGVPVILLHDGAWGGYGMLSWEPVIGYLESSWRLLMPDMLGFGHSDKAIYLDRPPYWSRVRQVTDFVAALGLTDHHIVGTSFGGSVALRGAASGEWSATTVTSIGGGGGPWRSQEGIDALSDLVPGREFIRDVVGMLVTNPDDFSDHIDKRLEASKIPGHYACLSALRLRHPDSQPPRAEDPYPSTLHGTTGVVAIEMTDDRIMQPGWSAQVTAAAPSVRAITMPGAHSPNLDNPAALADILTTIFLGDNAEAHTP